MVMCLCVHKSIKTRDSKVQQPNEYLVSLLLVSVQTSLVYEGSPPAFDAVAQGRIEMERCYNRLASFVLPLLTHTHTHTHLLHELVIVSLSCQMVLVLGPLLVLLSLSHQCLPLLLLHPHPLHLQLTDVRLLFL